MPTIISPGPQAYFPAVKPHPPRIGRKPGSKDRLQREAKWIMQETLRLCGGAEGFACWAKANPSLFYPLYMRCMVPKPVEGADPADGITIIVSAPRVLPSPPLPTGPPPTRQKMTYDHFHPSATWGEAEPVMYEAGQSVTGSTST